MSSIEIYNRMRGLGIKHCIISASMHNYATGEITLTITDGFCKSHCTDESLEEEIAILKSRGFDSFEVIHLHE